MATADDSHLTALPSNGAAGNVPRNFIEASLRAPVVGPVVFAACLVIIIIGLRYTAAFVAPLFLIITLAILFTPLLRWLERKGVPSGPSIVVMVAGLLVFFGAFFFVVYVSLQQLVARLPAYQAMLAILLSVFQLFARIWRPRWAVMGQEDGLPGFQDLQRHPA